MLHGLPVLDRCQVQTQGKCEPIRFQLACDYGMGQDTRLPAQADDHSAVSSSCRSQLWIHMILIRLVIHRIQLFELQEEDGPDNQLINSVYLDNSSMELYHGRLDKKPNALAIRIR